MLASPRVITFLFSIAIISIGLYWLIIRLITGSLSTGAGYLGIILVTAGIVLLFNFIKHYRTSETILC